MHWTWQHPQQYIHTHIYLNKHPQSRARAWAHFFLAPRNAVWGVGWLSGWVDGLIGHIYIYVLTLTRFNLATHSYNIQKHSYRILYHASSLMFSFRSNPPLALMLSTALRISITTNCISKGFTSMNSSSATNWSTKICQGGRQTYRGFRQICRGCRQICQGGKQICRECIHHYPRTPTLEKNGYDGWLPGRTSSPTTTRQSSCCNT